MPHPAFIDIGDCQFDAASGVLRRDGRDLSVGARALEILRALAAQRPRTVSTQTLLEAAWPDHVASINTLQAQVSALRRLVGRSSIATVQGRGYRLSAAGDPDLDSPPVQGMGLSLGLSPLRFQGLVIEPEQGFVETGGRRVPLPPTAMALLVALVQRRHRTVGKDELLDSVWPGRERSDNYLQAQVAELRRLLGAGLIATIPGQGYAFRAQPEPELEAAPLGHEGAPAPRDGTAGSFALVGRQAVFAAAVAAMRQHRLVSLVGVAGVGKTTLARALIDSIGHTWQGGHCWVDLAGVSVAEAVPQGVASALGMRLSETQGDAVALATQLAPLQLLLVMDNCEHLLPAVRALVVQLQAHAPRVHVLATSQQPLALPAEQVIALAPLPLPCAPGLEKARLSPAVQLFVEQAQAAAAGFALDAANVDVVVDICRQLDGLPLALALAAARVRLLGVEGLRSQLDERFGLLRRSNMGEGRARHDTLQSAMDWSHALLSAGEKAVYRRLAVFRGGFTAELARAVVADPGLDRWDVLDHLDALVMRSLVVASSGPLPRLHLLETTRLHARSALCASGELEAVQDRHARALAAFGDDALERRDRGSLNDYLFAEMMSAEFGNFAAAFEFAESGSDVGLALALADAWGAALFAQGRAHEALGYLLRLEERVASLPDHPSLGVMQGRLGRRLGRCGSEGRLAGSRGLQLLLGAAHAFAGAERPRARHECLWMAAEAALGAHELTQARVLLLQAESLEAPDWHPVHAVRRLNVLGAVHAAAGQAREAVQVLDRALALSAGHGLDRYALILRCDLAKVQLSLGRVEAAAAEFADVARVSQSRAADRVNLADALVGLADCQARLGQPAPALKCLLEAAALWARNGSLMARAGAMADLLARLGQAQLAALWLGARSVAIAARGDADDASTIALLHGHCGTETLAAWMQHGARLPLDALMARMTDEVAAVARADRPAKGDVADGGTSGVWVFVPTGATPT